MLQISTRDSVLVVELCHGKVNALDLQFTRALRATVADAVSVGFPLVIGSSKKIFGAGVDLRAFVEQDDAYRQDFLRELGGLFADLFLADIPIVTAVGGHAIAGGAVLALAGDRRLGADIPFNLGLPELRLGVPFPAAALEIVRSAVPASADELILSGDSIPSDEALRRGLLHEMTSSEDLLQKAVMVAKELGQNPAPFALAKRQLRWSSRAMLALMATQHDEEVARIWNAESTRDGIRRYLETLKSR